MNNIVEQTKVKIQGDIIEENPTRIKTKTEWIWWIAALKDYLDRYGLHIEKLKDGPPLQALARNINEIRNENPAQTQTKTVWIWWGGDCKVCIEQCGLHIGEPEDKPPLHPNCDCTLKTIEITPRMAWQLLILLERSKRVVREMNLLLKDKNLSERDRELLLLVRKNLDGIVKEIFEAGHVTDYLINELEKALKDAEKQASKVKFDLSLREANEATGSGNTIGEDDWYSDKALDKADELHKRLEAAAKEFGVPLRVVKAAFTDEFDNYDWRDKIQDRFPGLARGFTIKPYLDVDDFGLSNIDYDTASRLKDKYGIDIPEDTDLEDYLCTDEGCARFTAAAIKEAEEELDDYIEYLPSEKQEIMDDLNKEEKDALAVAIYKRGPEAVKENLDDQLDKMVEKRRKQKYIHVLEGYKAWEYWNREEEKP